MDLTKYLSELELLLDINEDTLSTVESIENVKKNFHFAVNLLTDIAFLLDENGKIIFKPENIAEWNLSLSTLTENNSIHQLFHPKCSHNKCHLITYWKLAKINFEKKESFEYQYYDTVLNRHLFIQYKPVESIDSKNSKNYFVTALFKDISIQKKIETNLYRAATELKTVLKALPGQYIRLDRNGTILDVNVNDGQEGLFFSKIFPNTNLISFFPLGIGEKILEAINIENKTNPVLLLKYSDNYDGAKYYFEVRVVALTSDIYMLINRNITKEQNMESIAETVNMMNNLGYIFSGIRHEIGNPINAIKMTMSVMKMNIKDLSKDRLSEYIERVLSGIYRVEYLLKSFKNFNLFEDPEPVDIYLIDFLNKFISILKEDNKCKNIAIYLDPDSVNYSVNADPRALHHVLLNIFSNAIDALVATPDARIDIIVKTNSDMIQLIIKDNGVGISVDQKENLFKPFMTTKAHGTGLGLVIVKKNLSRMGGLIEIDSPNSTGTDVIVSLPMNKKIKI